MKLLEDRIISDGRVLEGGILKVDSFLNHQIDPALIKDMAAEWKRLYDGVRVDSVLTIEASGIPMACFTALEFGCKCVFAKKSKSSNIAEDVYSAKVHSFTHGNDNDVIVNKRFIREGENVLIIDDFLANGAALLGLIDICKQGGANVVGCGIAIEKAFQAGGATIRNMGYRVESLARIGEMKPNGEIEFVK